MKPENQNLRMRAVRERGIALIVAMIALAILSLAAVALIRSVDTTTIVAGNLAFKRASVNSGDSGVEAAITWLNGIQAANNGVNVLTTPGHPFNQDAPAQGYYSSVHDSVGDPAYIDLFNNAFWTDANSVVLNGGAPDQAGNITRYIVQRMCRTANQPVQTANCLFSGALIDNNGQNVKLPQDICNGAGCPVAGQTPMLRITSRVQGPKNTVSYIQAFVF